MDLALLRRRGYFAAIDTELARSLCRTTGEHAPELGLAIALASRQVRRGHVCADLRAFAGRPVTDLDGLPLGSGVWPELGPWVDLLARSELVGDASLDRPLVLDAAGRLYLARYFEHERALAERILSRARPAALERGALRGRLDELLGATANEGQRAAAMIACLGHLTVVTGGPGTGKTTTVVKLLSLLRSLGPMRVLLLAPTGKAAQRLGEVQGAGGKASTIHRALGALGHRPGFVHDRHNPLEADVVVVDESSMVDIALMRRLCDAVPERARLILLGDAHQLASVEAGAVLGDICGRGAGRTWSEALHERARAVFGEPLPTSPGRQVAPLGDSIVELTHSHRFSGQGGIGGVADAIRRADLDRALDLLARADSEARLLELGPPALSGELGRRAVEGYSEYLSAEDPAGALTRLGRFRLLCAHRRGPRGVEFVNDWVERALADAGLIAPHGSRFYPGRPVMVTENDPALGLFNGDVGVLWKDPEGSVRAYFLEPGGGLRQLAPARLPPHETVYATSIHKSQGSEFDRVVVVLPDETSPLLTRELVYTAVTRARQEAILLGSRASFARAVAQRAVRASGLADLLWGPEAAEAPA